MGAKNCPETPRQRMIGMMYLVLTAMLALNVSADVLNAFTKVQEGLSSTIENYKKKNEIVFRLYIQHISLRTVSQFNHSHLQLLNIINQLTGCLFNF